MLSFQSQPISFLPAFAELLSGLVETQKQYESLIVAQEKPYVLDDPLIERLLKFYKSKQAEECVWLKWLKLWRELNLTREASLALRIVFPLISFCFYSLLQPQRETFELTVDNVYKKSSEFFRILPP